MVADWTRYTDTADRHAGPGQDFSLTTHYQRLMMYMKHTFHVDAPCVQRITVNNMTLSMVMPVWSAYVTTCCTFIAKCTPSMQRDH